MVMIHLALERVKFHTFTDHVFLFSGNIHQLSLISYQYMRHFLSNFLQYAYKILIKSVYDHFYIP